MTLSSLQTSGVGSTQPEQRSLQHSRRQTPAYRMGRWQPTSGEIHALVGQTVKLRYSRNGRMSVEITGPITLRSPRSSKVISSMNPQRAPTIRALHSSIRARLRRPKTVGKQICRGNQPVFDVRRIDCLARTIMSPVRSRCCRRAFFTQHVTVRTRRCRPPSVAVRSGGSGVVVEPGRMPVTDCDQAALCTAK